MPFGKSAQSGDVLEIPSAKSGGLKLGISANDVTGKSNDTRMKGQESIEEGVQLGNAWELIPPHRHHLYSGRQVDGYSDSFLSGLAPQM